MRISTRRFQGIFAVAEPTCVYGAPFIEQHRSINMDEDPKLSDGSEQKRSDTMEGQGSQNQAGKRTMSRRQFLVISAITGGVAGTGLLIGFNIVGRQSKAGKKGINTSSPVNSFAPNVWVRIDADN